TMLVSLRPQILHHSSDFERRGSRRHWLTKTHGNGIRNLPRQLPQKLPALETEDASTNTIQMYGNDRSIHSLHDAFHPAPKGKHLPDSRHLPFRKNADDLSFRQRLGCFTQGMNQIPWPKIRC